MFSINDIVIYTTYGICKISNIKEETFLGKKESYYVLHPLYEEKTEINLPVDNPMTKLRLCSLLSKDEINDILNQIPFLEAYWIERDNDRKIQFADKIKSGNRLEVINVIKSILNHIEEIKNKGRKLHATDESAMRDAEKLIVDEFSYVLELPKEEIRIKLYEQLKK